MDRKIKGFQLGNNGLISTHSQFMDDMIIVGKASIIEARNYLKILHMYEDASQ